MPLLALVPASPSDLEAIARVHFASWSRSNHPGFSAIFPKGATPDTLQHWITDMDNGFNDPSKHLMLVKDAEKGSVAAYALWQFCPQRSHDEIEREMLTDHFPLPKDANLEVGNRLIHNGIRKHHEVVAKHFGHGAAHAFLDIIGTNPDYARQGAASMLIKWGLERADDLNLPTYVEGTPMAKQLYIKHDFEVVDELPIEVPGVDVISDFCMIRPAQT